jgi:ankyrin repeat protein
MMPNYSHDHYTEIIKKLVHFDVSVGGVCAGFAQMWVQACLIDEEDKFYKRIEFISRISSDALVKEIEEAKKDRKKLIAKLIDQELDLKKDFYREKKLQLMRDLDFKSENDAGLEQRLRELARKNIQPELDKSLKKLRRRIKLEDRERDISTEGLIEIEAFFQSMAIYAKPFNFAEMFQEIIPQNRTERLSLFAGSEMLGRIIPEDKNLHQRKQNLGRGGLVVTYPHSVIGGKNYLADYFKYLQSVLTLMHPDSPVVTLDSDDHKIGLRFDVVKNKWVVCDINDLQKLIEHRDVSPDYINEYIMHAFENTDVCAFTVSFNTTHEKSKKLRDYCALATQPEKEHKLLSNKEVNTINAIRKLIKHNEITPQRINLRTERNACLFSLAVKNGDLELVKKILAMHKPPLDPNFRLVNDSTSLMLAINRADLDLVKLIVTHGANIEMKSNNITPLFQAVRIGAAGVVRLLLENKADVNSVSPDGDTPLHIATNENNAENIGLLLMHQARPDLENKIGVTSLHNVSKNNNLESALELLKLGARINHADMFGYTALIYATKNNNTEMVKKFLEKGANPNAETKDHFTPLLFAAKNNHLVNVKLLVENKAQVNHVNSSGWSALLYAADLNNFEMLKFLLQSNANPNQETDKGNTALLLAAKKNNINATRLLLDSEAKVNHANKNGATALMYAAQSGNLDILRLLLESKAEVNAVNNEGYSALYFAVQNGHLAAVRLLIENNANIDQIFQNGSNLLNVASLEGHTEIVKFLKNKINPDNVNKNKWTPLLNAASKSPEMLRAILEEKVNVDHQNKNGKTALMLSLYAASDDNLEMLLERKADLEMKDNTGSTALLHAAGLENSSRFKILLDRGANPHARNNLQMSPLLIAADEGIENNVRLLLDNRELRVDLEQKNTDGRTALFLASISDHASIVSLLLERKADPDAKDKNNETALHYAASCDNLETLKILISAGANKNAQGNSGKTPMHYAAKKGNFLILEELLKNGADENIIDNDEEKKDGKTPLDYAILNARQSHEWSCVLLLMLQPLKKGAATKKFEFSRDEVEALQDTFVESARKWPAAQLAQHLDAISKSKCLLSCVFNKKVGGFWSNTPFQLVNQRLAKRQDEHKAVSRNSFDLE